jgi:hypothetical protein
LAGFLLRLVFMHTCTMSRVQRDYRSIWNTAGSFRIVFLPSSFEQSGPICETYHLKCETACRLFTPSEGWTIEDEQCQKIGGGYKAVKFRFLLFL